MGESQHRLEAWLDVVCCVTLAILVWGVSALQPYLWQDDALELDLASERFTSVIGMFSPMATSLWTDLAAATVTAGAVSMLRGKRMFIWRASSPIASF